MPHWNRKNRNEACTPTKSGRAGNQNAGKTARDTNQNECCSLTEGSRQICGLQKLILFLQQKKTIATFRAKEVTRKNVASRKQKVVNDVFDLVPDGQEGDLKSLACMLCCFLHLSSLSRV
eukprot:351493-Hanusia_phi.AAC.1